MLVGDRVKYWDDTYSFGIGEVKSLMKRLSDQHAWVEFQDPGYSGWYHEYNLILVDNNAPQTKA